MARFKAIKIIFLWVLAMIVGGCATYQKFHGERAPSPERMVLIEGGYFFMGSNKQDGLLGVEVGVDELPQNKIFLPAFWMDQFEVTNRDYQLFVDQTGRWNKVPGDWVDGAYPPGSSDDPVSDTDWYDASAYCSWAGKRLPTEAEWEKAARGTKGNLWPWGDLYYQGWSNTSEERNDWKRPVGSYPEDVSPYRVFDMAGNVREWTSTWYDAYPGSTLERIAFGRSFRVLKGGSYADSGPLTRMAKRWSIRATHDPEGDRTWHTDFANGFRCAKDME